VLSSCEVDESTADAVMAATTALVGVAARSLVGVSGEMSLA